MGPPQPGVPPSTTCPGGRHHRRLSTHQSTYTPEAISHAEHRCPGSPSHRQWIQRASAASRTRPLQQGDARPPPDDETRTRRSRRATWRASRCRRTGPWRESGSPQRSFSVPSTRQSIASSRRTARRGHPVRDDSRREERLRHPGMDPTARCALASAPDRCRPPAARSGRAAGTGSTSPFPGSSSHAGSKNHGGAPSTPGFPEAREAERPCESQGDSRSLSDLSPNFGDGQLRSPGDSPEEPRVGGGEPRRAILRLATGPHAIGRPRLRTATTSAERSPASDAGS